jgi:hypothetical protein
MLKRKQQILSAVETVEGSAVTLGAGDAVLVYDPEAPADEVDFLSRVPAGPSLSRDNTPPGLTTRTLAFTEDFRGSGVIATAPSWGRHARGASHREQAIVRLTLTGMSSSERIQVGEIVNQTSAVRGIALSDLTGVNGDIVVMPILGTFAAAATVTNGEGGGAVASCTAISSTNEGFGYTPDSARLLQWNNGAWAPSPPAATGVVLQVLRAGFVVGAVQLTSLGTGSVTTNVQGQMIWGGMLNADVISDGVNSATLSADPTQLRGLSLTLSDNLDGWQRVLAGARAGFTLGGQGGEPLVFKWAWQGRATSQAAALQLVTSGLSAVRAPRLFAAFCGVGYLGQFYRFPLKSIQFDPGHTISKRKDANAAGGLLGVSVTDREPKITIEVDAVGMAFDWLTHRNLEQNIRFGAVLGGDGSGNWAGRTIANTVAIAAPNCQVREIKDGDQDGFSTLTVTLYPRRVIESGDDEYCLATY